jgi:hypothetical protein
MNTGDTIFKNTFYFKKGLLFSIKPGQKLHKIVLISLPTTAQNGAYQ